jgi:hypothetical protein
MRLRGDPANTETSRADGLTCHASATEGAWVETACYENRVRAGLRKELTRVCQGLA